MKGFHDFLDGHNDSDARFAIIGVALSLTDTNNVNNGNGDPHHGHMKTIQTLALDFTSSIGQVHHTLTSLTTSSAAATDAPQWLSSTLLPSFSLLSKLYQMSCNASHHSHMLMQSVDDTMKRCISSSDHINSGDNDETTKKWRLMTRAWSDKYIILMQPNITANICEQASSLLTSTAARHHDNHNIHEHEHKHAAGDGMTTGGAGTGTDVRAMLAMSINSVVKETSEFVSRTCRLFGDESIHQLWHHHLAPSLSFVISLPNHYYDNKSNHIGNEAIFSATDQRNGGSGAVSNKDTSVNIFGSQTHDSHYYDYSHFNQVIYGLTSSVNMSG
jgi:hypothetical protein